MTKKAITVMAAAGAASGAAWAASRPAVRALGGSVSRALGGSGNHWLVVTVNCPPERLSDGAVPVPVARLASRADVRVQPAPGNRGTELGLRLKEPPPAGLAAMAARARGRDPRQELRAALRDAKSLIETGEVLRPDEPGSAHPTAAGKVLGFALRVSGGEGRL